MVAGDGKVSGGDGNDYLKGGSGSDSMSGGDGGGTNGWEELLEGGSGSDIMNGGRSGDLLLGGNGDDKLFGGPGEYQDSLQGDNGDDLLAGGDGREIYLFGTPTDPGWGNDTISDSDTTLGGGGNVLSFAGVDGNRNVTVTLSPGPEATDGTNSVEWVDAGDFRKVVGGSGDDVITGDEWPNIMDGGFGANTMNGGGGNDVLDGDEWGSTDGGDGDDYLDNGQDGTLLGGNGNDHIRAVAVYSGSQSDVQGGAGDDNIESHNGVGDIIDCGDGTDTVTFDAGLDTVTNCE